MNEYRVTVEVYMNAENAVDARYKFEAELPDGWSAEIRAINQEPHGGPASRESTSEGNGNG